MIEEELAISYRFLLQSQHLLYNLDQYAYIRAFGETLALDDILKQVELQTFPWSRHPTAFIVKK